MHPLPKRLLNATIHIIPVVIFFILAFNLIVLSEKLMLKHETPSYLSFTLATITALIVGKCLLVINNLAFINAFPHKPLIYNILWKLFVYGSFVIVFRIVDRTIHLYLHFQNSTIVFEHLKTILLSPPFWAIQIWILMVFLIYIIAAEFTRVLGQHKIKVLLFGDDEKH